MNKQMFTSRWRTGIPEYSDWLDGRGSIPTATRQALGPTQPPIKLVPGVKLQGREADHSPPSSVEVKNDEAILPLLHTSYGMMLN
jgi:hypothetical protein